jgi:glycosyltransferase involved in cell wall biosynthesis
MIYRGFKILLEDSRKMIPEKKVIMIVSNAFEPDVRVYKEALTLLGGGYRVRLLAWDRERKYKAFEKIDEIEVCRYRGRGHFGRGVLSILHFGLFYVDTLKNLLKSQSQIIHCHDLDTLPVGFLAAKIKRTKLIYDAHEPEYYGWFPSLLRRPLDALEKQLARRADAVFVTNDIQMRKFLNFLGRKDKIAEIRNCPRDSFFRDPKRRRSIHGKTVLAWVGYIQDKAGIKQAVEAFSTLNRQFPKGEMLFVGKIHPNFIDDFKALIKGNNKIRIIDHVPYQNVVHYFGLIDIAFMLYEDDPLCRHITPTKLYEAMAQGIPVIATAVGDVRDIVEKSRCGYIVDIKKPNDIVEKMRILMADARQRRKMGERGYHLARKEYRWEIMEKRILQIYGTLS